MIHLITRENIDSLPTVAPALARAFNRTDLGKFWDFEHLVHSLVNYEAFVFYQEESGYAGVLQVSQAPLGNILHFFWSGKMPGNETPIDYSEVDEYLGQLAQKMGCRFIQCEGRRGWKPTLEKLGYTEDSVTFYREVTPDELPPI
ncbi:hypothetical protein [Pseudomonas phage ZCPS1]|uniref:Uncharacterized protein n=2 Tax=Bruynoghevirus TaxID=545932 RepID=A0A0A1IX36_9CAUD|nr:hypothetical protein VC51_gp57 [Pseudomonas phage vB_PaeP_C2-10_Ab22]YP_009210842.1 hypothetical protein AVV32_gp59 [Pseudomonas phage PhiCHU]AJD82752.1 hypothetical protein PhiCHU_59 [Pseudomonas phage PhiCHU]UPO63087.1 hypothetical protein [Pseudomonas phage ZCPS1]CEF89772.1 hypothetical protein [Pseudomonas phage vB_PaeP_C2-10_Ab22]